MVGNLRIMFVMALLRGLLGYILRICTKKTLFEVKFKKIFAII